MSANLPDSKGTEVELTQPTSQEILHHLHLNGQEWKGALSLEAYIRREDFLGQQALIRDGGLTSWALVTRNGDSERKVLSSCETIRKKALVRTEDGSIKEVVCHGIASVFCPPEYRGKGYAGRMIKDLGQALQNWQTDTKECLFSVLYSDIGKQFYAAHGWLPFPSAHVSLSPLSGKQDSSLPEARPFNAQADDLAGLCSIDEGLVRKKLVSMTADNTAIAIVPDVETLSWHLAREQFVSKELYGKRPGINGAVVGTEKGKRVWCVWTRMWYNTNPQASKGNTLHILRLVIEDPEYSDHSAATEEGVETAESSYVTAATAALLAAAQDEASKWHMEEIDIWNPTSSTLAAARKLNPEVQVTHRDKESIASLRWYGKGDADGIDWIGNEKYAWC